MGLRGDEREDLLERMRMVALLTLAPEAQGGTVVAESPPGQGARFTVRLPSAPDQAAEIERPR